MRVQHVLAAAAAAALVSAIGVNYVHADAYELPGNTFHSQADFDYSTTPATRIQGGSMGGVMAENAQNIGGGDWVGSRGSGGNASWPLGGDSLLTDGSLETFWNGGQAVAGAFDTRAGFSNQPYSDNIALSAAYMATTGTFNGGRGPVTVNYNGFSQIETIRIWAPDPSAPNGDGTFWQIHPMRVRLDYTMWNTSYWVNQGTNRYLIGNLRDPNNVQGFGNPLAGSYQYPSHMWPEQAVITAVNGATPLMDANGYAVLDNTLTGGSYNAFVNGSYTDHYGQSLHYVDLTVSIPVHSLSVAFEFGDTGTSSTHNMRISEIQAVPEPASLGLLGLSALGLLARRNRR